MYDWSDGISDVLIADLCVQDVSQPQMEALFDIRVVDMICCLTVLVLPMLCCVLLKMRRSESICKLVRIAVPHLHLCVFLWIACLHLKPSLFIKTFFQ